MKKGLAIISLATVMFFSSCIGSFKLFNSLLDWNRGISNKFVNELVFIAFNIVPVYGIASFVDIIVMNSIEFWSGNNPVSSTQQVIETENGKYLVESNDNGYTITKDGESIELVNNNGTWTVNGNALFEYVDETHVSINGEIVELSQAGVNAFARK